MISLWLAIARPDHGTVSLCIAGTSTTCDDKTGVEMDIEEIMKQAAEDFSINI